MPSSSATTREGFLRHPAEPILKGLACSLALIVALWLVGMLMDLPALSHIGEEDQLIENIGATAFFGSSLLFFGLFWVNRREPRRFPEIRGGGRLAFLSLAALFFFIAGEEISWGQRIFGWETPDWLKEHNIQHETSIHNLAIFNVYGEEDIKSFWARLFSMNRMFSIFWLSWRLLLPLAVRYVPKVRQLAANFGVPVPQLLFGVMFFSVFLAAKIFIWRYQPDEVLYPNIDELKETFYALIFLGVALSFVLKPLNQARISRTTDP